MATIKVINNYEIEIDNNKDHEAKEFKKIYVNPKTQETTPMYRTIGHYNNVLNALQGIYKDMCIQKANEKEFVSIREWIKIIDETEQIMQDVFEKYGVD